MSLKCGCCGYESSDYKDHDGRTIRCKCGELGSTWDDDSCRDCGLDWTDEDNWEFSCPSCECFKGETCSKEVPDEH